MEKLQDFQIFTNKEKIGCLPPDTWVIYSSYEYNGIVYRVMLDSAEIIRPIAIIKDDILHPAIENGNVTLLGIKRIKINKNKK